MEQSTYFEYNIVENNNRVPDTIKNNGLFPTLSMKYPIIGVTDALMK